MRWNHYIYHHISNIGTLQLESIDREFAIHPSNPCKPDGCPTNTYLHVQRPLVKRFHLVPRNLSVLSEPLRELHHLPKHSPQSVVQPHSTLHFPLKFFHLIAQRELLDRSVDSASQIPHYAIWNVWRLGFNLSLWLGGVYDCPWALLPHRRYH